MRASVLPCRSFPLLSLIQILRHALTPSADSAPTMSPSTPLASDSVCRRAATSPRTALSALVVATALAGCASAPPVVSQGNAPATPVSPAPSVAQTPTAPAAPIAPPKIVRPLKIGLALGGGAARGFAHVGVIKALEARGIHADIVVGTSAGSVVGAMYASGLNGFQLNRLASTMDEASISDWTMPFRSRGMLRGEALQSYVNKILKDRPIEQMPRQLGIVATDLQSGAPILFRRGNTGQAVRASSSVPGVFEPVHIGSRDYVDGGLVAPVPAEYARQMGADFVIAVDISANPTAQATQGQFDILMQTFTIMGQSIKQYELEKNADVVIRPSLAKMAASDFQGRNRAILAGEEAVAKMWPEIQRKLADAQTDATRGVPQASR
ncbi:esterase [Pandoraea apista]|nr:esterase [Pandoraea apista]AKH73622.1 esterase [Pandoraea apista]AKI62170.1 esterase [Pandoraea apista]